MGLALCRGERATEGRSEGLSWPPWGDETNPSGGAVSVGVVIIVESGAFFVVKIINLKETFNGGKCIIPHKVITCDNVISRPSFNGSEVMVCGVWPGGWFREN